MGIKKIGLKPGVKRSILLRNRKVAKSRGKSWLKNLSLGKNTKNHKFTLIRDLRVDKGWTQKEVAKLIGSSQQSYGAVERKDRLLSQRKANLLSKKLSMPLNSLFKNVKGLKYIAINSSN